MSITRKEPMDLESKYVKHRLWRHSGILIDIEVGNGYTYSSVTCSLDTARAIHAELTELFAILDEKV